jgi:thioredoxin-like negative regulator of GroEL
MAEARARLADAALAKYGEQMETAERTAWLYRQADSRIDLGDTRGALSILEHLEQQLPNDAGVKIRIARLLTVQESDPARPLTKWRQLAAQLKPQSDGWYEAKYNVAVLLDKSGESEAARKMLQYMQAIPPGWENSHLRDDFDKLLRRLR